MPTVFAPTRTTHELLEISMSYIFHFDIPFLKMRNYATNVYINNTYYMIAHYIRGCC